MDQVDWKPIRSAQYPLHQQIYEYLKQKILNGEWTVGVKIPPLRILAEQLNVNRSTVVAALEELAADGFIDSRVGYGTFVANNTWSTISSGAAPDWKTYVDSGVHKSNQSIIQEINRSEFRADMIRLGTGELAPEFLPRKKMKGIFQQKTAQELSLSYTEPKGSYSLRAAICDYLKRKGIEASPSSVLIVSGGLQALQLISLGLLQKGSVVFHESPSYVTSVNVFQSAGMNLLGVPMGDKGMKTELLPKLRRQHHASLLYTIPTFHNPTGHTMPVLKREELLQTCSHERLPILEDDVYGDLWFEEPPPQPLKANDRQGLVLYMGSISKTLGPGLRIGWLVGPEQVIDRLADIKMQTDYGSSTLSQYAVAQWLQSGLYDEHIFHLREKLKFRRDTAIRILEKYYSGIATWNNPAGGFYIWLKLYEAVSMDKLFKRALKAGILINPGNIYDYKDSSHIRISYSYAEPAQLEKGLKRLAEIIGEMSRR
ncbi:MocR-like pyridoxine biosynthesis transcription factor PdxR [Cytobacillus gottheilii]|uniref:MocR-like pyridoxine biosynthesis transcription factor PdxR n=1 Tax=Cytobacillus gottheilii TaxID=859144 RepID=UPI0009BB20CA|nr:PLP-dependent aminotransferase family protein [Cytobacillus gottheilii]